MKKQWIAWILALCVLLCAMPALATEDGYDLNALLLDWEQNGYPDDVCGTYYDEEMGCIVISLLADDLTRQAEIRAQISDAEKIGFDTATYSFNAMLAAMHEILARDSADIYTTGIGWTSSGGNVHGFGESGKEFRVIVTVSEEHLAQYTALYENLYQGMVVVEAGEPVVPTDNNQLQGSPAFSDAYGLYESWEQNGYPDDVCGVYSADGSANVLVVQLLTDDELRQEELRAMVADQSTLLFGTAAYTHNEMIAVQKKISENWPEGMHFIGIGWASDSDDMRGFGPSGNESRVVVGVDAEKYEEYRQYFSETYGDIVYVETTDPIVPMSDEGDAENPPANNTLLYILLGALVLVLFGVLFALRKNARRLRSVEEDANALPEQPPSQNDESTPQ